MPMRLSDLLTADLMIDRWSPNNDELFKPKGSQYSPCFFPILEERIYQSFKELIEMIWEGREEGMKGVKRKGESGGSLSEGE
jgi:hypothetical protein